MTGYIGCAGLIGIAVMIGLLFLQRKKIESALDVFYRKNNLFSTADTPLSVRQALGDGNWSALKGSLPAGEKSVPFYWLESSTRSTLVVNNVPQTSLNCFLAIAFPPQSVGADFIEKALEWRETPGNVKDFFVLNTDKPQRAERLADGSFLMTWQVLNRADVYQKKIDWLRENVTPVRNDN